MFGMLASCHIFRHTQQSCLTAYNSSDGTRILKFQPPMPDPVAVRQFQLPILDFIQRTRIRTFAVIGLARGLQRFGHGQNLLCTRVYPRFIARPQGARHLANLSPGQHVFFLLYGQCHVSGLLPVNTVFWHPAAS